MSPTTEIALVELLDEFSFEQDYVQVPATLQALRARERVILVQDESCEYVVTLERGRALKLWNPEMHWADQESEPFLGTLGEAVARATAWLARYLRKPPSTITVVIDLEAFPRTPIARPARPRGRARPTAAPLTELDVFDPTRPVAERVAQFAAWLRAAHGLALSPSKRELVTWFLEVNAAKLPLDEALGAAGLPVFLNPHFAAAEDVVVEEQAAHDFIQRFARLSKRRVEQIALSFDRYMAFMGLICFDACFESEADFEAQRRALRPIIGEATEPPNFDDAKAIALAVHDWNVPAEAAQAYATYQLLYLTALGLVDYENDLAGAAPTLTREDTGVVGRPSGLEPAR